MRWNRWSTWDGDVMGIELEMCTTCSGVYCTLEIVLNQPLDPCRTTLGQNEDQICFRWDAGMPQSMARTMTFWESDFQTDTLYQNITTKNQRFSGEVSTKAVSTIVLSKCWRASLQNRLLAVGIMDDHPIISWHSFKFFATSRQRIHCSCSGNFFLLCFWRSRGWDCGFWMVFSGLFTSAFGSSQLVPSAIFGSSCCPKLDMGFDPKVMAIAGGALGFLYIMAVEPLNPKTKRQEGYNPETWSVAKLLYLRGAWC